MAFPFILESNFELGTNAEWTSESDTGSLLDFPHYTELARIPGLSVPYRGAYCMRVKCSDSNATHMVVSTTIDIADAATAFARWYMYVSPDFTATADDVFNIFEFAQAGGGTVETSIGMRITAATNKLEIGLGDGTATTQYATNDFPRGRWVCVEVKQTVVTGSTTAVITLFVDGAQVSTKTDAQNAAAIGDGQLGTKAVLTTTTGTILFDQFVFDDLRIYPITDQFSRTMLLTKSGHVFVGPGGVDNITLLAGSGIDSVVSLFDTDTGSTLDATNIRLELKGTVASVPTDPAGVPVHFRRGCFVQLAGTAPRALVQFCPTLNSSGAIRSYAERRKGAVGGIV